MDQITPISGFSQFNPVNPVNNVAANTDLQGIEKPVVLEKDVVELSTKDENAAAPKIGRIRLLFNYLSDEQVKAVNEAGRLPNNAKFIPKRSGTGYSIHNNFFGLRSGTSKLPEGYEVRRNWLGFAIVVPQETSGLFVRELGNEV